MRIHIFDVSHGFCALLVADNGNVMLFDCGHNETTGFRPSKYLTDSGCFGIEYLFITNYDDDHVSDLANLRKALPIGILYRNKSVSVDILRALKEQRGVLSEGLESALDMAATYAFDVIDSPVFPSMQWAVFCNEYPMLADTNNLSLVVFVHYDGMGIVFPGDIEKAGWQQLLKNQGFRENLTGVNIFVASHHGRSNGYCEEVFIYCKPDIVIISDEEIRYDTQDVDYGKHAKGLPWNNTAEKRYVLTTRSDGQITITKTIGSAYHISV